MIVKKNYKIKTPLERRKQTLQTQTQHSQPKISAISRGFAPFIEKGLGRVNRAETSGGAWNVAEKHPHQTFIAHSHKIPTQINIIFLYFVPAIVCFSKDYSKNYQISVGSNRLVF